MRKFWSQIRNRARDESGISLVLVAISLSVLLGMAALAVDTGMLLTARTESQRVVDAAALAGAGSLILAPDDADLARQTAIDYAAENDVRGITAEVQPADVDVDLVNDRVRVRMFRTQARGNPIETFFARILGVDQTGVATVAAAEAFPGGAVYCPLPITLPDRWINYGSDEWDPVGEGDEYYPPGHSMSVSYTEADIGLEFNLFPSEGGSRGNNDGGRFTPSWYFTWLPEAFSGVPDIRERILGCPGDDPISIGADMWREAGNKQAVEKAFEDLIAQYPDEYFDPGCNCVKNAAGERVNGSLRWRPIPMFDPYTFQKEGSGPHFKVMNFAGVWIDRVDPGPAGKRNVWARFMGFTGVAYVSGGTGGGPGSMIKVLRLVE
jgi:Flp pilus assembly protein TadG